MVDIKNEIEDALFVIEELLGDVTIPKNVKALLNDVKEIVEKHNKDVVKLTEALYKLQEVSEDVNLPLNAKSDVWLLQSKVEKIKEAIK